MNIAEWLAATARRKPSAPALLIGGATAADYRGFAAAAASVGRYLTTVHGVRPGDRVGVFLSNSPYYLQCLFGIWWIGAIAVPINRKLAAREVDVVVRDADASVVFSDGALMGGAGTAFVAVEDQPWRVFPSEDGPVERDQNDCAWLFYTSGTTGRPKGVMLTNANLIAMSLCYLSDVDAVEEGDSVLYAAPVSHGAGLYGLIHVRMGSRHVFPASGRFDSDEILTLAGLLGRMSLFAAPTMVRRLVAAARARSDRADGIKTVIYGGGPMYRADIEEAMAVFGPRFVQIYGQGESPMTITALSKADHADVHHPRYRHRLGSVGVAQAAVQVRVCGADGRPATAGQFGEVEVRGATVMAGYWRDSVATAAALRNGWLRTGDLGQLDEDGYLTLVGRSKELIISGGSNIYPKEVEDALVTHPDIAEAAVIGTPDPEWGEMVVAYVVPAPGAEPDERDLDRHCLDTIARFKRPRRYHIVADLPKNAYGKVLKTALTTLAAGGGPDAMEEV